MHSGQIKTITFTGLFAALVFLATWTIKIPVGVNGGYIHFGDSLVYLTACILPLPYAMLAGAIGAGLSDILSPGGIVWLVPTLIIKATTCIAFTNKQGQILCRRNIIAIAAGSVINIVGYFLAEAVITGGFLVPLAGLSVGFIQPAGSAICFVVWAFALDKARIKQHLPTAIGGKQA